MAAALLYAAIWTRPPRMGGFNLSDTWAWLRYIPAIAPGAKLRLRQEWSDVDAHQKTIMSDDLGVGCTTFWLAEHLNFRFFVEARYFVNQLPNGFYNLRSGNKRGPSKAPDYIAISRDFARICVLECKGTQSNLAALAKVMDNTHGGAQKRSFQTLSGMPPSDSLVVGLFLAQHEVPESSTISISDPPLDDQNIVCSDQVERLIRIATMKTCLAKVLSLLNMPYMASIVDGLKAKSLIGLSGRKLFSSGIIKYNSELEQRHVWVTKNTKPEHENFAVARLRMRQETMKELLASENLGDLLEEWSRDSEETVLVTAIDGVTNIKLPFGTEMTLEIDAQEGHK